MSARGSGGRRAIVILLGIVSAVVVGAGGSVLVRRLWSDDKPITADAVVGSWEGTRTPGARLVLGGDGTFRGAGLPRTMFPGRQATSILSGNGQWRLVPPIAAPDAPPNELRLQFDALSDNGPNFVTYLLFRRDKNRIYIYYTVDDPDLGMRFEFRRVGDA